MGADQAHDFCWFNRKGVMKMSEVVKGSDTETFRTMMVAVVLIIAVLASLVVVSAYFSPPVVH